VRTVDYSYYNLISLCDQVEDFLVFDGYKH